MIDIKFLEKLLELLNTSQAGAIEVRKNLWSTTIRVAKDSSMLSGSGPVTYQVASAPPPPSHLPPPSQGGGRREESAAVAEPPAPPEPASPLTEIKSPMVGTYYAQPEPGAEPYVAVGARIKIGQTLCIIEAMKIMNPIEAEAGGRVSAVLAENGHPVEFGQPLFIIT